MAIEENTNWGQSVTGVVIRDDRVLLARHTYGAGRGLLIVPGGYVKIGESPERACMREIMEETGILARPTGIIGIRFNQKDWYVAFSAEYQSGTARSDQDENSEVVWMPVKEALRSAEVPDLTKKLIESAGKPGLELVPYEGSLANGPYTFYGAVYKSNNLQYNVRNL